MDIDDCTKVFRIPKKNWWVLLTPDGTWGFERQGEFVPFTSPPACMPLLPLLEFAPSEAADLVVEGLKRTGADGGQADSFPFPYVIHLALSWATDYWPTLAVEWLENGFPLSTSFADCLSELQDKKRFSQHLRHRAALLVRRHQRGCSQELTGNGQTT